MLLGRVFGYADAHRYRIGTNYLQLPVNQPKVPVRSYTFDGAMVYHHRGARPVYSPNSAGGPVADLDHLVDNVTAHLRAGVSVPVLERAVAYRRAVDKALGDRVAAGAGVA